MTCNLETCNNHGLQRIRIVEPHSFNLDENNNVVVKNSVSTLTFPNVFNKPTTVNLEFRVFSEDTGEIENRTSNISDIEIGQYEYNMKGGVFFVDFKGLTDVGINFSTNFGIGGSIRTIFNSPEKVEWYSMTPELFEEICNLF